MTAFQSSLDLIKDGLLKSSSTYLYFQSRIRPRNGCVKERGVTQRQGARGAGRPGRGYVIRDSRDELGLASSRVTLAPHAKRRTRRHCPAGYRNTRTPLFERF